MDIRWERGKFLKEKVKNKNFEGGSFVIWRVEIPSTKIVKNLSCTYKKIHCKGDPYRFNGYRNLKLQEKKSLTTLHNRIK